MNKLYLIVYYIMVGVLKVMNKVPETKLQHIFNYITEIIRYILL